MNTKMIIGRKHPCQEFPVLILSHMCHFVSDHAFRRNGVKAALQPLSYVQCASTYGGVDIPPQRHSHFLWWEDIKFLRQKLSQSRERVPSLSSRSSRVT